MNGQRQRRKQRQLHIDREHDHEPGDEEQDGPAEVHQAGAEELAHGGDIVRDAGQEVTGLVVVEEFLVKGLHV